MTALNDAQHKQTPEAPHELDLAIDFVNTLDTENDSDALATTGGLADWLSARGLLSPGQGELGERDRLQAVDLREALRSLMLANNGGPRDDRASGELELAARRGDLGVHFAPGDSISLAPGEQGVAGALARVLVPVAQAIGDDSWQRVKACRAPDCLWAFYDRSRNRSGVWCEMAVCGNRTKVRAYRERAPRKRS
jgi:predicted RNA-binding Zn ribbon-like protein